MADQGSFRYHGHRITYDVHGEGDRVLVLVHGLLMNRRMYDRLAPEMASRGNRVIIVDLLGHGESDKPPDMRIYSMNAFADQLAALIDHLDLSAPVVGGTSLGANVTLELAAHHPDRAGALFIEMPVLEDALLGAALIFTPILLGLRFGKPVLDPVSEALRRGPANATTSSTSCSTGCAAIRTPPGPCSRGSCSAAPHPRPRSGARSRSRRS